MSELLPATYVLVIRNQVQKKLETLKFSNAKPNTMNIIPSCNSVGIAARLCADLNLNGYNDWYLPRKVATTLGGSTSTMASSPAALSTSQAGCVLFGLFKQLPTALRIY
ncbi:hypothetical protein [Psychroflexus planctonicus]|uniref:hypothetical protein n=1 Tax=Psychroflexus planctonicus TaxID=1526575 RepID=UPI001889B51E|nr:hypothetical protein [Psychroflexus planctonicus]